VQHLLCGDKPIGANLMLIDNERLLDKYFCMKNEKAAPITSIS